MRRVIALGLLAVRVFAGTPEGVAALEKEDYRAALKEFVAAADAGDAEAQFQLGEMYRRGLGVGVNPRLAERRYEQADAQGHMAAAAEWGILRWKAKKREEALALLHKSADAGNCRAMYVLALLAHRGAKIGLTLEVMFDYWRQVGEAGHADAQCKYAWLLWGGHLGGPEGKAEAEEWYRKALAQGAPDAYRGLGICLVTKAKQEDGSLHIDVYREGLNLVRQGALHGDFSAQHALALTQRGDDFVEAYTWCIIGSDPKNSWPAESPGEMTIRKASTDRLKDLRKSLRKILRDKQIKPGEEAAKEYAKEIAANMKKGLPWEDPLK